MLKLVNFIRFTISISGPFIISFGTYSGLLKFLEIFFQIKLYPDGSQNSYMLYLSFLYISGFLLEQKSFDLMITRKSEEEDDRSTRGRKDPGIIASLISGGYSQLVRWFLNKDGISFYDVFKKPSYWKDFPKEHKTYPIFRLEVQQESIEIRYHKAKKGKIVKRTTKKGTSKYGDWCELDLKSLPFKDSLKVLAPVAYFHQRYKLGINLKKSP